MDVKPKIAVSLLTISLALAPVASAEIGVGSTKAEIIAELGQPTGGGDRGDSWVMIYPGGLVELRDGKVVRIDRKIVEKNRLHQQKQAFAEQQRAQGLVLHKGVWVTPERKAEWIIKDKQIDSVKVISDGGKALDLEEVMVPGKITIVDFYAKWCGPCRVMSPHLEAMARKDGDVFLRKVDIVKWGTPVADQYRLQSIPNVRVFDRNGKIVGIPTHDLKRVRAYVAKAKKK